MENQSEPPKPRATLADALKKRWPIIAGACLLVGTVFAITGPLSDYLPRADTAPPSAVPASPADKLQQRAADLHRIELARHPYAQTFLFADYEEPDTAGTGTFWGKVFIYSSTRDNFVKVDEQSCSYPDGTQIDADFEKGVLLVSCSFPSFFQREEDRAKKESAYAVTTLRFFDSNRNVTVALSCACPSLVVSQASVEPAVKQLKLRVVTQASEIYPSGYPSMNIKLEPVDDSVRDNIPVRSFLVQFGDDWSIVGFHRL